MAGSNVTAPYLREMSTAKPLTHFFAFNTLTSEVAKTLPTTLGDCVKKAGIATSYQIGKEYLRIKEEKGKITQTEILFQRPLTTNEAKTHTRPLPAIYFAKEEFYPPAGEDPIYLTFKLFYATNREGKRRVFLQFKPATIKVPGKGKTMKTAYVGYTEEKAEEIQKAMIPCLNQVLKNLTRNVGSLREVTRGNKGRGTVSSASAALGVNNITGIVSSFLVPGVTVARGVTLKETMNKHRSTHFAANPNARDRFLGLNRTMKNKKENKGPRGAGGDE